MVQSSLVLYIGLIPVSVIHGQWGLVHLAWNTQTLNAQIHKQLIHKQISKQYNAFQITLPLKNNSGHHSMILPLIIFQPLSIICQDNTFGALEDFFSVMQQVLLRRGLINIAHLELAQQGQFSVINTVFALCFHFEDKTFCWC